MTAITQNLPWFIKDLGVSIIGEECYTTLIHNLNLTHTPCLTHSLSKGLGLGIVLGGSIMKLPQIHLIVSARSARGLSLPSYLLETTGYLATLAYAVRHHFPFSTYGENAFLGLQNIFITFLIVLYAPPSLHPPKSSLALSKPQKLVAVAVFYTVLTAALYAIPSHLLTLLQLSTLPLSLLSKLPQITANYKAQSTGQLSLFAVASQILGCTARVFTTMKDTGDVLVTSGFVLALLLNAVLGIQMWSYWGKDGLSPDIELKEKKGGERLNSQGLGGGGGPATKGTLSPSPNNNTPSPNTPNTQNQATSLNASTSTTTSLHQPQASHRLPVPVPQQQREREADINAHRASPSPISFSQNASQIPVRVGTPTGGRKWARKVD